MVVRQPQPRKTITNSPWLGNMLSEKHPEEHGQKVSQAELEEEKNQADEEAELTCEEIKRLSEQNSELQKVIEENNAALKVELASKDEAKSEVIRQLALSIDMLQQENYTLCECIHSSKQHPADPLSRSFDLKKLTKDLFSAKLFTADCKPLFALYLLV